MEIFNVSNISVNNQMENIFINTAEKSSFANVFNSIREILLTAEDTSELKSFLKSRNLKENIEHLSELEDKYCSLCGSMIEEDGSCPLCGVPVFISGKGQSRNRNALQVDQAYSVFKYKSVTFPKSNKVGHRG